MQSDIPTIIGPDDKPIPVCPYCHTPVTDADSKGRHVNGIKPIEGDGCEFCNPSESRNN